MRQEEAVEHLGLSGVEHIHLPGYLQLLDEPAAGRQFWAAEATKVEDREQERFGDGVKNETSK